LNNSFLVSGYEFYKLCKISFCPRYQKKTISIEENDLVFVNLDNFEEFLKNLPEAKFRLITHNSDSIFSEDHLNSIKKYVNKIYPINCVVNDCSLIQKIPLGFVDTFYKPHKIFAKIEKEKNIKSIFVYLNFSVNTNYNERSRCLSFFKDKHYVIKEQDLPATDFYRQLAKSQYSISPQGTGIDCHRVYESIFFDCIPIIKKGHLDDFYKKLPILIVDDWDKVNEQYLNNNYELLFNNLMDWKLKNQDWYTANFWLRA
jgi:hypothetical protein